MVVTFRLSRWPSALGAEGELTIGGHHICWVHEPAPCPAGLYLLSRRRAPESGTREVPTLRLVQPAPGDGRSEWRIVAGEGRAADDGDLRVGLVRRAVGVDEGGLAYLELGKWLDAAARQDLEATVEVLDVPPRLMDD